MSQPRILIFTHDGRGLGHLRRLSRLGEKLQESASVLFVTGHREASWLVPPSCEYVHLPNLDSIDPKRSRQWARKPFILDDLNTGKRLREALLGAALTTFRPNGLIVDYLPLGIDGEMTSFVTNNRECRKFFISRGVLGNPDTIRRDVLIPQAMSALRDSYDRILVMADARIIDTASEYGLESAIAEKIQTVGYAAEQVSPLEIIQTRQARGLSPDSTWVVCSAGGGKDGEDLIESCWRLSQLFPECVFDIIVGSRSRLRVNSQILRHDERVRLITSHCTGAPLSHASADVVITRGGYNSLIEACVGCAKIIVAPISTDYEQRNHAMRLKRFRPIVVCPSLGDLDLALLDCLEGITPFRPKESNLDLGGVDVAARIIMSDLLAGTSSTSVSR